MKALRKERGLVGAIVASALLFHALLFAGIASAGFGAATDDPLLAAICGSGPTAEDGAAAPHAAPCVCVACTHGCCRGLAPGDRSVVAAPFAAPAAAGGIATAEAELPPKAAPRRLRPPSHGPPASV